MCYSRAMIWKKFIFETLESTNKTALEYPPFTVIVAKSQTAGKGRYGHSWSSPPGNLYMSAVLPDLAEKSPFLAFIVALSVAQSLKGLPIKLKWPNDVLLDGKKLAGILLETTDKGIVAGIGVNVVSCPTAGLPYQAAHLKSSVSCEDLTELILDNLTLNLQELNKNGFKNLRQEYMSYLQGLHTQICVNLPDKKLVGIFKDLSASGALILQLPDKTLKEITAGVVFLMD